MEPSDQSAREWLTRAIGRGADGLPMPKRDAGDARQAPELRILLAWIEAQHAETIWATMAQFESAWLAIQAGLARQAHDLGSLADRYLPSDIDPALRQLFALPSNQAQAVLLGQREENGAYIPGWAGFSEPEFRAIVLWLEPVEERDERGMIVLRLREPWEIARDMTPERALRSFGRRAWVKEDTARRYLSGARQKLRLLFGLENPNFETGRTMDEAKPDPAL